MTAQKIRQSTVLSQALYRPACCGLRRRGAIGKQATTSPPRWAIVAGIYVASILTGWGEEIGAQQPPATWKLTWSDEFQGTEIDRSKWDFEIGNGFYNYHANQWIHGWGNDELQYYTREPSNALVAEGMLHIRAIRESLHGCGYSSARLKSRKRDQSALFNQRFGRFEFRARLPAGQGLWPALWMMPQEDSYGPWPASGEIDVMEARGQEPGKILGTLHYGSRWPANVHASRTWIFPEGTDITDFHLYAIEWEPGEIRWFVDDHHYATQSFWWSSSSSEGAQGRPPAEQSELHPWPAPFDRPFYLVMNLAVGGKFAGQPDPTTVFPAEMVVDYVRVYEKVGDYGEPKPRGQGKLPLKRR